MVMDSPEGLGKSFTAQEHSSFDYSQIRFVPASEFWNPRNQTHTLTFFVGRGLWAGKEDDLRSRGEK